MTTIPAPLSSPQDFARAIPARVKYLTGKPRNYRFNAKAGSLNHEGTEIITEPGATFALIPLAARIFRASLFKTQERDWLELFFLNQAGHLCTLAFHSSSVDRFKDALAARAYYDEIDITQALITVKPMPRKHKQHGPYYVAEFQIEALPAAAAAKVHEMREVLAPIYRADTITPPESIILQDGYSIPRLPAAESYSDAA